jgi:UDP-glucose 4-epimerase
VRDLSGSSVLVTGGAGFIGSHLVDALLARGARSVAVVDTFFLGKQENLDDARQLHGDALRVYREDAGELSALTAVVQAEQPDVVFNLATRALLYSFFNPAGACKINLDIALALGELLRTGAYGRLVHLSSSEVYGSARQVPMDESHPLLAETSYAAGKAAGDLLLASYVNMFGCDIVTLRPFNNYGPRQNAGALAAVVPLTIARLRQGRAPVLSGDGSQTRDFIHVGDTVETILRVAERDDVAPGTVLNIGSGHETSIAEIVSILCDIYGYNGPVERAKARAADVLRHCADTKALRSVLGDVPGRPLTQGLRQTAGWYDAETFGG